MNMVAKVEAGKTPSKDAFADEGIPYFKMYNLRNQAIDFDFQPQFIKPEVHYGQLGKSRIHPGDLIMNIVGPPLGKLAIVPDSFPEANTNQAAVVIHSLSSEVPIIWLFYYLSEMSEINSVSTRGSAGQVNISVNQSREMFVAIPPLAEQVRIVGALGKYLALVDGIERDRAELDSLFVQLKSKVLDLAVRGELTERDPEDEPASELLARIREEKLAMVGRGELKPKDVEGDTVIFTGSDGLRYEKPAGEKGETKCIEGEIPFEIPKGWGWARLKTLCLPQEKRLPSGERFNYIDISSIDNSKNIICANEVDTVDAPSRASRCVHDGSVVFSMVRPYLRNIAQVPASLKNSVASTGFYVASRASDALDDHLLFQMMLSDYAVNSINTHMKGDNSPSVRKEDMDALLLPIPPHIEQRRIANRIEEVFDLLD